LNKGLLVMDDQDQFYSQHRKKLEEVNMKVIRKLMKISIFAGIFMIIEFIGGWIAGSLAIMTDAAHLLSDLSGFIISMVSLYIATRPANFELTYGYHRAEVVGALASVLIIWVLTIWLVKEAIDRLIQPHPITGIVMLCISICGLIFNIIMGRILASEDVPNAFERVPEVSIKPAELNEEENNDLNRLKQEVINTENEQKNLVMQASVIHILGDMIQAIGVIIAATIIYFFEDTHPGIVIVDPICTFLFCIIVVCTTIPVTKDCINVLMEASPREVDIKALAEELVQVVGVVDIHDMHLWSISVGKPSISLHILSRLPQKTLEQATLVCKKYKIYHITIQVEDFTQNRRPSFIKCNHVVDNAIH